MSYLKQDTPIPGQKFALISFVEPKNAKLLMNRESFFASHFIRYFLEQRQIVDEYIHAHEEEKKEIQLDEISKEKLDLRYENIQKLYYEYVQYHGKQLDNDFNQLYNEKDEIIITGFKIRGVYPNMDVLQQNVDNFHQYEPYVNIYTAPVGVWIPYCPSSDLHVEEKYAEDKLNEIMHQKGLEHVQNKQIFANRMNEVNDQYGNK